MQSSDSAPVTIDAPPANHAWVSFDVDTVVAEIARTPDARAEGLIYRDKVPDGTGMLFVFEDVQIHSSSASSSGAERLGPHAASTPALEGC
ncbi:MAG: DUF192 domain-containing protein [Chloroflexi bacterium]|nr:DUF192 domain-containing protein [Chloroflexota bacterium]